MAGEFRSTGAFRISPVDRHGRTIDPAVLKTAEAIGRKAIEHGERVLGDPALAADLLEESASAVSRVVRTKQERNETPIQDMRAYLFRAFIRKVNRAGRHGSTCTNAPAHSGAWVASTDLESKILLQEFITRCDTVTRDMLHRRLQGFSWKEISRVYGISAHAAESRFSQAVQRVRKRLGLRD